MMADHLHPIAGGAAASADDQRLLDEFERLERDNILDDDDVELAGKEETTVIPVVAKMPKFTPFRVNPNTTFDMWGTTDESGLEKIVVPVSKEFAPVLEEEVELRKVRFYETVTPDGMVRLVYCFLPDKDEKVPNTWLASKQACFEKATTCWVTMRSKRQAQQYVFRASSRDLGTPQFSGMSRGEL